MLCECMFVGFGLCLALAGNCKEIDSPKRRSAGQRAGGENKEQADNQR